MIQKKICMLGTFAVGKTSLVRRFTEDMFSEKYLTTVGVKIDKKEVELDGNKVMLSLWDLEGEDDFTEIKLSYLRGASGYLLVADGTRAETFDIVIDIHKKVEASLGTLPFLLLINKCDLTDLWEIEEMDGLRKLSENGWDLLTTSAKTGLNVDTAFTKLVARMIR